MAAGDLKEHINFNGRLGAELVHERKSHGEKRKGNQISAEQPERMTKVTENER